MSVLKSISWMLYLTVVGLPFSDSNHQILGKHCKFQEGHRIKGTVFSEQIRTFISIKHFKSSHFKSDVSDRGNVGVGELFTL